MKKETKSKNDGLTAKVLAAAVSLSSTGCIGFKVKNDFSMLLSSGYSRESGRQAEVGVAVSQSIGEGIGTHSLRVGFLASKLSPKQNENSRLEIGNIINEDVETSPGERGVLKFSLAYHNEAWGVRPYNWLALAALLGGGVEIVSTYSTDRVRIGNSDSIEVPNLNLADKVKFFVDPAFEVRLGPKPYAIFPIRMNSKISFNGCEGAGCIEPGLSFGYTINWSGIAEGKGGSNACKYLPDRKDMPLEFSFEGKEERNGRCVADYHQESGRHLTLELNSCRPKDCIARYNSMVETEKEFGGKEVKTTPECYGTERPHHSGKETVLLCNLYNNLFHGSMVSQGDSNDRSVLNSSVNHVRDKVEMSLRK